LGIRYSSSSSLLLLLLLLLLSLSFIAGACPGPALTNVTSGNIYPLIYIASLILGQYTQIYFNTSIDNFLYQKGAVSEKGTIAGIPQAFKDDTYINEDEDVLVKNETDQ